MPGTSIVIRKIDTFPEMDACVHLQQSVWQFPDLDVVPRRMFVVARAVGGQLFGAWDEETLAGFALAIPAVRNGQLYLHSQMVAVSPQYRNRGIGMQLKLAQRMDALSRGIEKIEWTFDPLRAENANFNIERLGAIVRRYTPDFYGSSKSPLHGSLPSDRLHAEWWLKSDRVASRIAGQPLPPYTINETVTVTEVQRQAACGIHAPVDSGLELLLRIRRQFLDAFSSGLVCLRFHRVRGGASGYLLGTANQLD